MGQARLLAVRVYNCMTQPVARMIAALMVAALVATAPPPPAAAALRRGAQNARARSPCRSIGLGHGVATRRLLDALAQQLQLGRRRRLVLPRC